MLGKLLKYEMRASARMLLPLYAGTLLVAALCSLQMWLSMPRRMPHHEVMTFRTLSGGVSETVTDFSFFLFLILCVVIVVLTIVIVVQRYNRSLLGDEGYLMFTLPVTHTKLLLSKFCAAVIWVVVGIAVMCLGVFVILLPTVLGLGSGWAEFANEFHYLFRMWNPLPAVLCTVLDLFANLLTAILILYLSLMIGQMEQFSKYRIVVAVGMFFLISWASSLLESLLSIALGAPIMRMAAMSVFFTGQFGGQNAPLYLATLGDIAFNLALGAGCFAGTVWLMKHKLNL